VYPVIQIPPAVNRLLIVQDGVISTAQAHGLGVPETVRQRLVRDGRWSHLERGIFLRGVAPATLTQEAWAGHLLAGRESAIGGRAALFLRRVGLEPESIQVVIPLDERRRLPLRYEVLRDGSDRLRHVRGTLPTVSVEDAVIDAACGLAIEAVVGLVTDAIRENLTTAQRVARRLDSRSHVAGGADLMAMLRDLQGIESNLEFLYRRDVERAHGLPTAKRQVRVPGSRFDMLYEEFGLIVEVDGRKGHVEGRFRDYNRDNTHAESLLTTLRYGGYDIRHHACGLSAQVSRVVSLRGWAGPRARCRLCAA
jgi:very-short-patch-repair endonuclease